MNIFKIKLKKKEETERRNDITSLPMGSQTAERILNSSFQNLPDIINHSLYERSLNLSFSFILSPVISRYYYYCFMFIECFFLRFNLNFFCWKII